MVWGWKSTCDLSAPAAYAGAWMHGRNLGELCRSRGPGCWPRRKESTPPVHPLCLSPGHRTVSEPQWVGERSETLSPEQGKGKGQGEWPLLSPPFYWRSPCMEGTSKDPSTLLPDSAILQVKKSKCGEGLQLDQRGSDRVETRAMVSWPLLVFHLLHLFLHPKGLLLVASQKCFQTVLLTYQIATWRVGDLNIWNPKPISPCWICSRPSLLVLPAISLGAAFSMPSSGPWSPESHQKACWSWPM